MKRKEMKEFFSIEICVLNIGGNLDQIWKKSN